MSPEALVRPDKPWEKEAGGLSGTGGLWWDPEADLFKLFYNCGCGNGYGFCVATSPDGVKFIPIETDTYTEVHAEIEGPGDTPFEGGVFRLELFLPGYGRICKY